MPRKELREECDDQNLTEEAHAQKSGHHVEAAQEIVQKHRNDQHRAAQVEKPVDVKVALELTDFPRTARISSPFLVAEDESLNLLQNLQMHQMCVYNNPLVLHAIPRTRIVEQFQNICNRRQAMAKNHHTNHKERVAGQAEEDEEVSIVGKPAVE